MINTMLLDVIKMSLWGNCTASADIDIFKEMKQQAIAALPMKILDQIELTPELKKEWKLYLNQHAVSYIRIQYEQINLPINVPFVVLKGSSAARYYPYPECRTMGDIDIMTRREDFDIACQQLVEDGYKIVKELNREICFNKNGIIVELHHRFATLNDPIQVKYLDEMIIENITSSHVLPDLVNGLVLLEHIDQHLEGGLGLKQIIDWMMFVDKCLSDENWFDFKSFLDNTGLTKLAIVTTRMCELYLGLPTHEWCAKADVDLCKQLLEYVIYSGNFGNKRTTDADISENTFAYASTPKMVLKLLQKQGLHNWEAVKKYTFLRPIAWVYQANRYIAKGLNRKKAISKLMDEYNAAKKRNAMFDALGVKTAAKGKVIYKDGKYVKE